MISREYHGRFLQIPCQPKVTSCTANTCMHTLYCLFMKLLSIPFQGRHDYRHLSFWCLLLVRQRCFMVHKNVLKLSLLCKAACVHICISSAESSLNQHCLLELLCHGKVSPPLPYVLPAGKERQG